MSANWLQNLLIPLDGIESISKEKELIRIQCSVDISAAIAKTIIEAGLGLRFLNRKEYGLDAIYNRYFEGGI
jgi:ABC-2 type transport system ATP-binding protein